MEHRNDGMNTLESLGREALYADNVEHRNDGMNLDQSLNITVPRQKYVRNDEYAATIVARFIKDIMIGTVNLPTLPAMYPMA